MITIIHGEDTASSRSHFLELKSKSNDPTSLQSEDITLTDLAQIFDGGNLFSNEKSVFIENFLSKKKSSADFELLLSYLKEKTLEHSIVLWESKELDKKTVSLFSYATVKNHSLPQTLFLFLDSLKPQNGQSLVKLFHKTLEVTEAELIFYMLVRHVRVLIAVKNSDVENIDELKRLAPWQQQKMQRQAQLFTQNELFEHYKKLYVIEKGQKTGVLTSSLEVAIDIFLIDI